jgi:chromosome segregation ATPase
MHSGQRMIEAELKIAKKIKEDIEEEHSKFKKRSIYYEKNYNVCKAQKEQIEHQMSFTEERIAGLVKENAFLNLNVHEYEIRLTNRERLDRERVQGDPGTGNRTSVAEAITELHSLAKMGQEPGNTLIRSDHKKYLPIEQVEVYDKRYDDLSKLYNEVLDESQEIRARAMGEQEIIKERDYRIGNLHLELKRITGKFIILYFIEEYNKLENEHAIVLIDRDAYKYEAEIKNNELSTVTVKLGEINKSRNKLQTEMASFNEKIKELKKRVSKSITTISSLRMDLERADNMIMQLRNESEDLNSKIILAERNYDQSQTQYEEKITALTEMANQNKKKKESWANNYEKEMKAHSDTKEELIKSQTKLKEVEMASNNLRIASKAVKKQSTDNEERNSEINNQLMKLAIENEQHMRDSKTKAKLLEIIKEECDKNIEDLEQKVVEEKDRLMAKEQLTYMQMEDAFSLSLRWEDKYKLLTKNLEASNEDSEKKADKIDELKNVIEK